MGKHRYGAGLAEVQNSAEVWSRGAVGRRHIIADT